jgi:hypothetical protein
MSTRERWNDAVTEVQTWLASGLRLQRPDGSALHQLLEAWHDGNLITPPGAEASEHFKNVLGQQFHTFVIEHDWARAFENSDIIFSSPDKIKFRQPYDHCCFEFVISAKRVLLLSSFDGHDYLFSCFVRCRDGWSQKHLKPPESDQLRKLLHTQHQALMIALDAAVATTSIVRAPERLNRARIKKDKLPLFDYHVIQLAHRTRPETLPPENESERNKVRLHFRRGHWRHFETFKTWINWMLVGDPDLGFIDKHYRL